MAYIIVVTRILAKADFPAGPSTVATALAAILRLPAQWPVRQSALCGRAVHGENASSPRAAASVPRYLAAKPRRGVPQRLVFLLLTWWEHARAGGGHAPNLNMLRRRQSMFLLLIGMYESGIVTSSSRARARLPPRGQQRQVAAAPVPLEIRRRSTPAVQACPGPSRS